MILDTLAHSARYETLHPRFALAFAFLRDLTGHETEGRHDIAGDEVFALVQRTTTKPPAEAEFEAHRRYIDIQCVLQGRETILWVPLDTLSQPTRPYQEEKDVAKWKLVQPHTLLRMEPGSFAIFYPEDAHSPCVAAESPETVTKVVIKVRAA